MKPTGSQRCWRAVPTIPNATPPGSKIRRSERARGPRQTVDGTHADLLAAIRNEAREAKTDPSMLANFQALRTQSRYLGRAAIDPLRCRDLERIEVAEGPEMGQGYALGIDLGTNAAMSAAAAMIQERVPWMPLRYSRSFPLCGKGVYPMASAALYGDAAARRTDHRWATCFGYCKPAEDGARALGQAGGSRGR